LLVAAVVQPMMFLVLVGLVVLVAVEQVALQV
jgi:hypothetical protein